MEQNPNEETVDVNTSPKQPEAKDTRETTDDTITQDTIETKQAAEADSFAAEHQEEELPAVTDNGMPEVAESTPIEHESSSDEVLKADTQADMPTDTDKETADAKASVEAHTLSEDASITESDAGKEAREAAAVEAEGMAADQVAADKEALETDVTDAACPIEDTAGDTYDQITSSDTKDSMEEAVPPVDMNAENDGENVPSDTAEKTKKKKNKPKLSRGRKIVNGIIIAFLAIALLGSSTGAYLLYHIAHKADPDGMVEQMRSDEPSVFYASDGKTIIGELGEESRENITYEQVPQSTIDAFLAIEDSRFYSHNGFDLPRFISSAINNLKSGDLSQGGSTLTMQTVDNFIMKPVEDKMQMEGRYFSTKEKIERKIQEIYLSMCLDSELI